MVVASVAAAIGAALPAPGHARTRAAAHAAGAPGASAPSGTEEPDDLFRAAHDAAQAGDRARLASLARRLSNHPLASYVEYWQLLALIKDEQAQQGDVDAFIARHPGTVLADRLRTDWMIALGAHGDLAGFDEMARGQVWWRDDPQVRCYAMLSRYRQADRRASVAAEARDLLLQSRDTGSEACMTLASALIGAGDLAPWRRIRNLVDLGLLGAARRTAVLLPLADATRAAQAIDHPEKWLVAHARGPTRSMRAATLVAIARLAREQPERAAELANDLLPALAATERGSIWGRIGHMAAYKLMPEAVDWYRRGGDTVGTDPDDARNDEVLEWQVRAALRARPAPDWTMVHAAVQRMTPDHRKDATWTYWDGRAQIALGRIREGRDQLASLAGGTSFYGRLACEDLGMTPPMPPQPPPPTPEDIAPFASNAGLQRALKLLEVGLQNEGVREWNWQMRGLNDRQLLAAAEFARTQGVIDRMISTSERTQVEIDLAQRFPAPLGERLSAYTSALGLDEPWVNGLIRQESRFSPQARSATGAQGLMQLMPATARFVARRLGLGDYAPERIAEPDVNLRLGTAYLRMVLDDLDGVAVLATAAYNAGPGRVRQWRAALTQPLDGLIFTETIPLSETREYVKRVMANSVVYAAAAGAAAPSLRSRLATIVPKAATTTDLP
ncbi:MAG TPA: transglycosylase SLT domain-containing protein [Burkholderiaceae bacterium]|nr:transglycosylase SLT domain-containing protein [Burkholderiaceae bacterium]